MTSLLPIPELQFFSDNGVPLAGGSVATFAPGTSTPKVTYATADSSVINTNPIILDAAGRCIVYGAGDYRFVVKNSAGNLLYDQLTSSYLGESTISAVMLPVVGAATLATARDLMGVTAAINAAVSAVSLITGPTGATSAVTGPTGPTGPTGSSASAYAPSFNAANPGVLTLQNLNATAANCFIQFGNAYTNSGGSGNVTFAQSYPNALLSVVATATRAHTWLTINSQASSGFSVNSASPEFGGSWNGGPVNYNWLAIGY